MVDKSAIGATDDPFTMVVEAGKVREFARATMSDRPDYLASIHRFGDVTAVLGGAMTARVVSRVPIGC